MFKIEDATESRTRIIALLRGNSGSGKTLTALLLARGIVGKSGVIGVIDCEGRRSEMYAGDPRIGGFKILHLAAPFSSDRFRDAIKAIEPVCDIVIVDSATHEHMEMLEFADREERNGKKAYTKWTAPKVARKRFYSAILTSTKHMILTQRMVDKLDIKSHKTVVKVDGDESLAFEMDLVIDLDGSNRANFVKVPQPLHSAITQGEVLGIEHGARLAGTLPKPDPDLTRIRQVVSNLEDAATSGMEILQTAYVAAIRGAKNEDEKTELERNLSRLKLIAKNADEDAAASDEGQSPDDDFFPGDVK